MRTGIGNQRNSSFWGKKTPPKSHEAMSKVISRLDVIAKNSQFRWIVTTGIALAGIGTAGWLFNKHALPRIKEFFGKQVDKFRETADSIKETAEEVKKSVIHTGKELHNLQEGFRQTLNKPLSSEEKKSDNPNGMKALAPIITDKHFMSALQKAVKGPWFGTFRKEGTRWSIDSLVEAHNNAEMDGRHKKTAEAVRLPGKTKRKEQDDAIGKYRLTDQFTKTIKGMSTKTQPISDAKSVSGGTLEQDRIEDASKATTEFLRTMLQAFHTRKILTNTKEGLWGATRRSLMFIPRLWNPEIFGHKPFGLRINRLDTLLYSDPTVYDEAAIWLTQKWKTDAQNQSLKKEMTADDIEKVLQKALHHGAQKVSEKAQPNTRSATPAA